MNDIQSRIQDLKTQLESIERAERYRKELEKQLLLEQSKVDQLQLAMDKEHQDVIDLENWSLKELFIKVSDKEAALEKEKEEYLQAAMAFREAQKQAEMIVFEIGVLQEKVAKKSEIEQALKTLYQQQETDILSSEEDHPLKSIIQKSARWQQLDRELEETILRGVNVQVILEEIATNLNRAKKWAHNFIRDDRYRLRMISEEMDQARLRLPKLRMEFVKFEREIKEVFQFAELESWEHNQWEGIQQVQQLVKELSEFTQTFLHGLIRDWLLQQQLHRTHTLTNQLKHESETTVKWLRLEKGKVKQEIARLERERQDLLNFPG